MNQSLNHIQQDIIIQLMSADFDPFETYQLLKRHHQHRQELIEQHGISYTYELDIHGVLSKLLVMESKHKVMLCKRIKQVESIATDPISSHLQCVLGAQDHV